MRKSTRLSRTSNRSVQAADARLVVMVKHPAPGRVKTRLAAAVDGGYYLIGVKAWRQSLFRDIRWGSDGVFAATRRRARRLGLRTHLLPPTFDVDEGTDLKRLAVLLARGAVDLPRTATILARLGSRPATLDSAAGAGGHSKRVSDRRAVGGRSWKNG